MTLAEEEIAYYSELGRAMAEWAEIEQTLYVLVSIFFPIGRSRHILAMGFVGVEGFRAKLSFADKAITRALVGTQYAPEWPPFCERLNNQNASRNRLAHYQTLTYPEGSEGRRFALSPRSAPKGAAKDQPIPGAYCVREIIKVRLEFQALRASLLNLLARLSDSPEPLPKSDEQPADPPTLQQITRQIHEELGHPQQSAREKRLEESARNAEASLVEAPQVEGTRKTTPKKNTDR